MQHPFGGGARITYPRAVAVSAADPAGAVALPRRLQAVPGGLSRPVRIGNLMDATTDDFYRQAAQAAAKVSQVFQIMNPQTQVAVPGTTSSTWSTPSTWGAPSSLPSWVLPAAGIAGVGLVLLLVLGGGGRRR